MRPFVIYLAIRAWGGLVYCIRKKNENHYVITNNFWRDCNVFL